MRPALPFTSPWLLAPMEGVTEPCFRDLVLEAKTSSEDAPLNEAAALLTKEVAGNPAGVVIKLD